MAAPGTSSVSSPAPASSRSRASADVKRPGIDRGKGFVRGVFSSPEEVRMAYDHGEVALQAKITCRIDGVCQLKGKLHQALQAWMAVLDGVTLAELVAPGTGVSTVPLTAVKRRKVSPAA